MEPVKANSCYIFNPTGYDVFDPKTTLQKGEIVRVVNLPGCPRANTMRHCHVQAKNNKGEWEFAGLVLTASLDKLKG